MVSAVAILLAFALSAQSLASDARSVRFHNISTDEGLSQSFVYTIVQDQQGFMWFGTQEGLNRFDGFEFTVFVHDPNDPQSISDETIRTMIKDRTGNLWIGTDSGGLSRYDPATQAFTNYLHDPADPTSIGDNRVRVIYEDSSGALWIGTDGAGLDRFDPASEEFFHYGRDSSVSASLSGNHVWSILEDSSGILWVATERGLNRLDADTRSFTHYKHDPDIATSISDDRLRFLFEDKNNALWIGTETGGLNRFDRESESFEHFVHSPDNPSSISANRINTIFQDGAGVLWIGTEKGLNAWNPTTRGFKRYFNDPGDRYSLSHDNVTSIYQDRGGMLWFGTYSGLSQWNQTSRAMLHYRNDPNNSASLSENTVTSFAEDRDGNILIGTFGGGLNILDRSTDQFVQLRHAADDDTSLSSDQVMAVHVDSDGVIWAGTRGAGLNRYDADTDAFTRYRHDPDDTTSISSDSVTYILEDRNKALWIGTFGGGLNYFDRQTNQFKHFRGDPNRPRALSNDRVLILYEDSAGTIWIGTYGGGLNRLDPATGTFTHYRSDPGRADGLSGDEIYLIQEDIRGDLWIGVKGSGLNRWRKSDREVGQASFQRFTRLDGLPSSTTYGGVWDQTGYLWLSTARGLSRLDIESLEFRNYDTSHGLQGDEFNLSASYRASDGQVYFGGLNGFNAFRPELLARNLRAPQVAVTKLRSLNKPVDFSEAYAGGERVKFTHDQNVIGFEFMASDYAAPNKNRFMYQLEGLDQDWVEAGTQRQVTYTNLPAGDYTFRVRASNIDGVWSEQEAVLGFYVIPAPWKTWWAYLVYVSILAAALIVTFRTYAQRERRVAALKYAEDFALVQARLNEAQRIASIGNWDLNTVTNELWWSDEVYRLFQTDPDEFEATYEAFLARVHPEDREAVKQAFERALRDEEAYSIDHRIIQADGTERIVQTRAEATFSDEGQPVRMVGTIHDVTERRKAEDEINRNADYQGMLAQLSSSLITAHPDDINAQVSHGLELVGTRYGLDAVSVWWLAADKMSAQSFHRWDRDKNTNHQGRMWCAELPWTTAQLLEGKTVVVDDLYSMPAAAAKDRELFRERGMQSVLMIPLQVDKELEGLCVFSIRQQRRKWSAGTIAELGLVARNLAWAIARSRAVVEICQLKEQLQQENLHLREEVRLAHSFDEIVGEDPKLGSCLSAVEKVASTDATVLIYGETGTGKKLIAHAVHNLSARRDKPMVKVHCPTLSADLIESELFGHEIGAFAGAQTQRRGRIESANTGTLFLDEIGELPIELQSKLLRVLQSGEFERLGGSETLRTDVRLIAATSRNLIHSIERGEFLSDLYYRICRFPIHVPALRDRKGDIPLLAAHFVRKHARILGKRVDAISAKSLSELSRYAWPGNIRELESTIERCLIASSDGSVLELPDDLPWAGKHEDAGLNFSIDIGAELATVERSYITSVLEHTGWKISGVGGAASILDVPASTLRSKMERLGIVRPTTRKGWGRGATAAPGQTHGGGQDEQNAAADSRPQVGRSVPLRIVEDHRVEEQ